jgi:hypothetical protein
MSRFVSVIINPIEQAHSGSAIDNNQFRPHLITSLMHSHHRNEHLADELSELSVLEFMKLPNWMNILRMSFYFISDNKLRSAVLEKWYASYSENSILTDFVIFYVIRAYPINTDIYDAWIKNGILQVKHNRDISLLETLILTLGNKMSDDEELLAIATYVSMSTPTINRLLSKYSLV